MKYRKSEKGEVVVEASIIVTLVALFITILLYMSIVLYQKTLVSVMANQTAANIAQNYSNNLRDPFTGYIDTDKVYQSITYSDMKTDAYKEVVERKANLFAQYRLKSSRMLISENTTVDVKIIKKPNELLKNQVVVTIYDSYDVPLIGFFGENGLVNFAASGRADCDDYLEYLNGVQAIGDPANSPIPSLPDSDTCLVTFLVDKLSGKYHAVVPVLRGKSIISSAHFSHSKMPDPPINNGLEFIGWVTESGNSFSANDQINENITVYGAWLCTIAFDPTGGAVIPETMKVQLGKTAVFPVPTRYSYSFEGWFTQKEGNGIRYISNITQIKSNVTLYAHWKCTHAEYNHELISEATCISRSRWKATCRFCGYSYNYEGGFGEHRQNGFSINIEPSCTTRGRQLAICEVCTIPIIDRELDALGHNMKSCYIAPLCEINGYKGSQCERCGHKVGTSLDPIGHNYNGYCGIWHVIKSGIDGGTVHFKPEGAHSGKDHYSERFSCVTCLNCGKLAPGERGGVWYEYDSRDYWETTDNHQYSVNKWCYTCYKVSKKSAWDSINTHTHEGN